MSELKDDDSTATDVLAAITENSASLISGIPAPIQRNLLKSLGRLLTAAVDVPVAKLEGIAAETRATTEARIASLSASSKKLAKEIAVPVAYVEAASEKFARQIVNERLNVDRITLTAVEQLKNSPTSNVEGEVSEIDEDWLNSFEAFAKNLSSQKMQNLFGKILAGEIQKPGSFSPKTLQVVTHLSQDVAALFQTVCSLCIYKSDNEEGIWEARVVEVDGAAGSNGLSAYGLNYRLLTLLMEHGLVKPDLGATHNYADSIIKNNAATFFAYQGRQRVLQPTSDANPPDSLPIAGVALTRTGRELLSIVDFTPNTAFESALTNYFAAKNLRIVNKSLQPGL